MSTQPGWTYLDYTSYGTTTASTVLDAYGLSGTYAAESSINVAFILPRANMPKAKIPNLELLAVERVDQAVQLLRNL